MGNFRIDCNGKAFNQGLSDEKMARAAFDMYCGDRPAQSYTFELFSPQGTLLDVRMSGKRGGKGPGK